MDVTNLTLGEIAKVEELSGISINAIGNENSPQGKTLAALVFVFQRRENPKFTFNDAMNLGMDEVQEILGLNDVEDEDPFDPKED